MYSIFSHRLGTLRQAAGMSQKQLAVTLHVTAATLSNYENGIYLPSLDKAVQLAMELGCSLDYLCGLTDSNIPIKQLNHFLQSHIKASQILQMLVSFTLDEQMELFRYMEYLLSKQPVTKSNELPKASSKKYSKGSKSKESTKDYLFSPEIHLVAEEKNH